MKEKELNLQDIQQAEFEVLKEIAQICEEKRFRYFLAYGTLLGAVRHQGFIPWDDDVDIMMFREDRDKLIHYLKTEYQGKLVVCDRSSTKNYPYGIPRICDMSYKYVSTNPLEHFKFEQGVFVDVYALDPCGNSRKESDRLFKRIQRINGLYSCYLGIGSLNPMKQLVKQVIGFAMRILRGSDYPKKIDREILETIKRSTTSNDKYLAEVAWAGNYKIYEKDIFNGECKLRFNGCEFNAPKGFDTFLKRTYGNYMKLPPEEKRVPYHGYKIFRRC